MKIISGLLGIFFISFLSTSACRAEDQAARWVRSPEGLNMRDAPSITGKVLVLIPDGAEVTVLEETGAVQTIQDAAGRWTRVEWNGLQGWVFGGFLVKEITFMRIYAETIYEFDFIQKTHDEGYILSGFGSDRQTIVKMDRNGSEQWRANFPEFYINSKIQQIIPLQEGGYLVAGYECSSRNPDTYPFLMKIDNRGIILWHKKTGVNREFVKNIFESSDGGCVVNLIFSPPAGFGPAFETIIKTDLSGNEIWRQDYNRVDCLGITENHDLLFFVQNYTRSETRRDPVGKIIALGKNGEKTFISVFQVDVKLYTYSIIKADENNYFLYGFILDTSEHVIIKTDRWGKILWKKPIGKGTWTEFQKIINIFDGEIAVLMEQDPAGGTHAQLRLLKIDERGNQIWDRLFSLGWYTSG